MGRAEKEQLNASLSQHLNTVHASVVDSSFKLMKESVSLYGLNKDWKLLIPQLAGAVWEACDALKKTPSTNVTAIGRAVTQVAELHGLQGDSEAFIQACDCLKSSLSRLDSALDCPTTIAVENQVQQIDLNS